MPTTPAPLTLDQLATEAASCMLDTDIDLFIETCITDQLKIIVEESGATLADTELREAGRKKFTAEEIELMKECELSQISFEDHTEDTSKFKLVMGEGKFILFSNRPPTQGELRGTLLKEALSKLKIQKPEMTLYDALNKLIKNPKTMVPFLYTSIFGNINSCILDNLL